MRRLKKKTAWEKRLERRYGISAKKYFSLLHAQGKACAICKRLASSFTTRLCVDHNHKTGEIRGLLCHFCNQRVIGRHTDPELFANAAEYLRGGTGWIVPASKKKRKKK